jgi:integrase
MLDFWSNLSANEADFSKNRHRTLPIPDSISPVPSYPSKLRIYRTNASQYWQVQSFFKGKTYRQSLRTTNKAVAFRAAKEFFHLKVAELFGSHVPVIEERPVVFRDLVDPALSIEQARNERGEFSSEALRILQNRLYKKVVPFFGDMPIMDVGYSQVSDFVNLLSREGSSTTTIQQYLVATRKVLNHAYVNNLIKHIPKFPSVKISVTPRGSFAVSEYRQLVRAARLNVGRNIPVLTSSSSKRGAGVLDRNACVSVDLEYLIVFMVNSFVRPSDIKNLQHQHVTVVRGEYTYLRLNLPESKRHDKPIVTMIPAVRAYERLSAINALRGYTKPTDYVFCPEQTDRRKLLEHLGYQFRFIQEISHIGTNAANDKERTLYSLRHTAITFRLLYGGNIDLLTLARNARTSVEMVEKFYASNLTAEMNIGLLQGKRSRV